MEVGCEEVLSQTYVARAPFAGGCFSGAGGRVDFEDTLLRKRLEATMNAVSLKVWY